VNTDGINLKNRIEKMETERELAKRELDAATQRLETARATCEQAPKNLEEMTRHLNENTPTFDGAQREFSKQSGEFEKSQQVFLQKEGRYRQACEAHSEAQKWHQRVQTRITELGNEIARLRGRQSALENLVSAKVAEVATSFDSTTTSLGSLIGLLAPFQVPGIEFTASNYAPTERRWVSAKGLQTELKTALLCGPSDLATLRGGISCLKSVKAWFVPIFSSINAEIDRLNRAQEARWRSRCISLLGKDVFAALNVAAYPKPKYWTVSFEKW
jgi:flagellar biosynthesis chaperone FliJ